MNEVVLCTPSLHCSRCIDTAHAAFATTRLFLLYTLSIRYANRAKNIKNKPKINEDPKDAMLRQYKVFGENRYIVLHTDDCESVPLRALLPYLIY